MLLQKPGSDAVAFGELNAGSYAELATVTNDIETVLLAEIGYDRINYLMLMMVDPHVHFHVIPRYSDDREFDGLLFVDAGWPKTPDLTQAVILDTAQIDQLVLRFKQAWPNGQYVVLPDQYRSENRPRSSPALQLTTCQPCPSLQWNQ